MPSPVATRQTPGRLAGLILPAALAAALPAVSWGLRAAAGVEHAAFDASLLFWVVVAVVVVWLAAAAACWRLARPRVGAVLRARAPGFGLALLLTGAALVTSPPSMRVQFDETSLVGVSLNLHRHRAAMLTTAAIPFDGAVMPLENTVDKRPPLFPFLVALLHDATGYRIANAFAVNAALLVLLLATVHEAVRRRLGTGGAAAAQLLLVGTPLVPVVATSAGFELLAALLFTTTVVAALDARREPTPARAVWFFANGLLFAWSRYESLLLWLLLTALLLWRTRTALLAPTAVRWLLAVTPGLLLPLAFLFENAQRPDFYPEAMGRPLVALQHAIDHVGPFATAFCTGLLATPWPGLAALAGLLAYAARLCRRAATFDDVLVALPVAAATAIALAWFYGDVREPTAQRLFLPAAVLGALAPLLLARGAGGPLPTTAVLAGALALAAGRLHALHRGEAFPRLQIAATTEAIDEALRAVPDDDGRTLWVTCAAQHLVVKGRAAMPADAFRRRAVDVQRLIAGHHLQQLLVLETPLDDGFAGGFGSVRDVLAGRRSEVVWRSTGAVPITVHRVGR